MKKKIALITGINGQDGSYLAELLLAKDYIVHGTKRRSSTITTERIHDLLNFKEGVDTKGLIELHHADLTDSSSLSRIIESVKPDEIYNLAAQSHVAVSFEEPEYTANSDALGTLRLLETIRRSANPIKFYQASTSELFGGQETHKYNENSRINPRSPYAAAKAYAYYIVKQYREAYGLFAVNGILFNHERPRRGENFVTRKITRGISSILNGVQSHILLGNLNAKRDWGHAADYVDAMWRMLQCEKPEDFIISMDQTYQIREFCKIAWDRVGVTIEFSGKEEKEVGKVLSLTDSFKLNYPASKIVIGSEVIQVDKAFYRPLEVDHLVGDSTKARSVLNWIPKYSFTDLVYEMVDYDISKSSF